MGQRSIRYQRARRARFDRTARRLEFFAQALFFAALGGALVHFLLPLVHPPAHYWQLADMLTLAALILPVGGATLGAILSHREYKHLSWSAKGSNTPWRPLTNPFEL